MIEELLENEFRLWDASEDFDDLFEDGSKYLQDVITEASTQVSKKNVFQKLWDAIKKIVRWIVNQIRRLINWIKSKFAKNTKSVDQIVDEIGASKSSNNTANDTANGTSDNTADNAQMSSESKSQKIEIPSNPKSTVKPVDLNLIYKSAFARFDRRAQLVFVKFNKPFDSYIPKLDFKGKTMVRNNDILFVYELMKAPGVLDDINNFFVALQAANDPNKAAVKKIVPDLSSRIKEAFNPGPFMLASNSVKFSLKDLSDFQGKLNTINGNIDKLNTENGTYDAEISNVLNKILSLVAKAQMGINAIVGVMNLDYEADARYIGCIKDIETLSEFVEKCVKSGVPNKYIMSNAYILCDKSLHPDNSDKNKPIWGQSRFVFIDEKNGVVHKVAYNSWGKSANVVENTISKIVEDSGKKIVAPIIKTTGNMFVVDAEYVDTSHDCDRQTMITLKRNLDALLASAKSNIIVDDIHENNVGVDKNNNWVIIDYGNTSRSVH